MTSLATIPPGVHEGPRWGIPAHVEVAAHEGGPTKASVVLADQIRTISRQRLGRRPGTVAPATMVEVDRRLRLVPGPL